MLVGENETNDSFWFFSKNLLLLQSSLQQFIEPNHLEIDN